MKVQIEMLTTFYITNKTNIWPHTVRVLRRLNENGYGNLGHNVKTCFKIICRALMNRFMWLISVFLIIIIKYLACQASKMGKRKV